LKSSITENPNSIDELISGERDTILDLNSMMREQNTIVFKDNLLKSSLVIIFTKPILINTVFGDLEKGLSFLSPYVDDYSILNAEPILGDKDNIIEGLENEIPSITPENGPPVSLAGYCQPIDENDPSISKTAGIIVPLDSSISSDKTADSTIRSMLNFFGFFILIITSIIITPIAHRILIIELILDNENFSAQRKLNRTKAAEFYTGIVFFGFAIAFINYGIINKSSLSTILGFYAFIFLVSSILVLQYKRIFNPLEYLTQFKTKGVLPTFENSETDWGFISDNILMLFFNTKKETNPDPETREKEPYVTNYQFQPYFIILVIIYSLLIYLFRRLKVSGDGGSFFLTSIYFYVLLFSIYIISLVSHYRIVNTRLDKTNIS
jgi:hypothetical protein